MKKRCQAVESHLKTCVFPRTKVFLGCLMGAMAHVTAAGEQAVDRNIFVEGVPVQAPRTQAVRCALFRSGVQQAGKPRERNAERASVLQLDPHCVVIKAKLFS
jgi:hypothetical protein